MKNHRPWANFGMIDEDGNACYMADIDPEMIEICESYAKGVRVHRRRFTAAYLHVADALRQVAGAGKCIWRELRKKINSGEPLEAEVDFG